MMSSDNNNDIILISSESNNNKVEVDKKSDDNDELFEHNFGNFTNFMQKNDNDVITVAEKVALADIVIDGTMLANYEELRTMYGRRCSAHTVHLAVGDAFSTKKVGGRDGKQKLLQNNNENNNIVELLRRVKAAAKACKTTRLLYTRFETAFGKTMRQECPTRWNSKLTMLGRLLSFPRTIVNAIFAEGELHHKFTSDEWQILTELVALLTPVRVATEELQSEKCITACAIIPVVHDMNDAVAEVTVSDDLATVKARLLQSLQLRFEKYWVDPLYQVAALLDPTIKEAFVKMTTAEWK